MKINSENKRASQQHRSGRPLGVATGVGAVVIAAAAVFGGVSATSAAASPAPSATPGSASAGAGSAPSATRTTSTPAAFTITSQTTTPIDAGTVTKILASCLGSDASEYHAVIAVRTPIASEDTDGAVIAVNSAHQYVQCETKGDKGTSQDNPPTFINDRLWGTGHTIEYFDSIGEPAGQGQYLLLGAGHYTSDIAKVTISYGDDSKQYPAIMAGGAFFYTAAVSTDTSDPGSTPSPYVHAYNASGKEIYNQKENM